MQIFVDTGAWFAYFLPDDDYHHVAHQWFKQNRYPLITTDYVIDELLTLLLMRDSSYVAILAGKSLFNSNFTSIKYLKEQDILEAWQVFQRFQDKGWSFTDCTSKVIIERLNISYAFAFDKHFEQFGSVVRVP